MLTAKAGPDFSISGHSKQQPHWSFSIDWPADRWDPMSNAPTMGEVIMVRGRDAEGRILEPMHYAYGGGEEQPAFIGWFVPMRDPRSGFTQVSPVEWQPLVVRQEEQETQIVK